MPSTEPQGPSSAHLNRRSLHRGNATRPYGLSSSLKDRRRDDGIEGDAPFLLTGDRDDAAGAVPIVASPHPGALPWLCDRRENNQGCAVSGPVASARCSSRSCRIPRPEPRPALIDPSRMTFIRSADGFVLSIDAFLTGCNGPCSEDTKRERCGVRARGQTACASVRRGRRCFVAMWE